MTVALEYDKIENHPERISNIEPFIDKYNWKDIDFPSRVKDRKNFEQNNEIIALNILYLPHNTKQIRLHTNQNITGNQVILLMITIGKKWHYLAVKNLSRLLRGKISNLIEIFINCFHSYSTRNRLKKHERVCNDHDYCHLAITNKDNKTLEYNHGEKSLKAPFFILVDTERLLLSFLLKIILKYLTQRK